MEIPFCHQRITKFRKKLRTDIYRKVENFSNNEFDKFGTASLITRTTNDVNQIQMVMQMFLRLMINAPLTLIGASFMAYNKDPQLTKIFLYVLPIMAVLVRRYHVFSGSVI